MSKPGEAAKAARELRELKSQLAGYGVMLGGIAEKARVRHDGVMATFVGSAGACCQMAATWLALVIDLLDESVALDAEAADHAQSAREDDSKFHKGNVTVLRPAKPSNDNEGA